MRILIFIICLGLTSSCVSIRVNMEGEASLLDEDTEKVTNRKNFNYTASILTVEWAVGCALTLGIGCISYIFMPLEYQKQKIKNMAHLELETKFNKSLEVDSKSFQKAEVHWGERPTVLKIQKMRPRQKKKTSS